LLAVLAFGGDQKTSMEGANLKKTFMFCSQKIFKQAKALGEKGQRKPKHLMGEERIED